LRSLDGEIGGGGELQAARDLGGVVALEVCDVRVAFERRQRDVAENLFTSAFRKQVLSQGQTMIVSGDETDQHYRFGAVVEQSVQSFESALTIVGEQMIAEFEVRQLAGAADQFIDNC
jgi:hypothetical protein